MSMHTLLNEVIPRGMINTAHKNYKNKSPSANMRNLSSWPRVQETPKTPQYIVVTLGYLQKLEVNPNC